MNSKKKEVFIIKAIDTKLNNIHHVTEEVRGYGKK